MAKAKTTIGLPSRVQPLRGWSEIAHYLGQPVGTVQRWAKSGMPISRQGRYMTALPDELDAWLGRESRAGQPVHVPAGETDLGSQLRTALKDIQKKRGIHRVK